MINYLILIKCIVIIDPENRFIQASEDIKQDMYTWSTVSTWSRFKTHLRHSVVFLGKTLYGVFPCLVVLTSSSKLQ